MLYIGSIDELNLDYIVSLPDRGASRSPLRVSAPVYRNILLVSFNLRHYSVWSLVQNRLAALVPNPFSPSLVTIT